MTKLTPDVEDSLRTCLTHLNQPSMRWTNKKLAKFFEVSEVTMRRWIDKLQLTRFVVDGRNKMSPFYNKDRNSLTGSERLFHCPACKNSKNNPSKCSTNSQKSRET